MIPEMNLQHFFLQYLSIPCMEPVIQNALPFKSIWMVQENLNQFEAKVSSQSNKN